MLQGDPSRESEPTKRERWKRRDWLCLLALVLLVVGLLVYQETDRGRCAEIRSEGIYFDRREYGELRCDPENYPPLSSSPGDT